VGISKLSIATKLYAIFAAMAMVTVALAGIAVFSSQQNAARTSEFEAAFRGAQNVERVNSLIYAVVMESRGIYMSPDTATAKKFGVGLLKFNDRIGDIMKEWQQYVRADDADLFREFAARVQKFQEFRRELVRLGTEVSPAAGREWGDNDANRNVRTALNKDMEALAERYASRSRRIYAEMEGHGSGRRRQDRYGNPLPRAFGRDRRSRQLDRRVPGGNAAQRRPQSHGQQ
jgi:methyl-accepting chemotaxis protein